MLYTYFIFMSKTFIKENFNFLTLHKQEKEDVCKIAVLKMIFISVKYGEGMVVLLCPEKDFAVKHSTSSMGIYICMLIHTYIAVYRLLLHLIITAMIPKV